MIFSIEEIMKKRVNIKGNTGNAQANTGDGRQLRTFAARLAAMVVSVMLFVPVFSQSRIASTSEQPDYRQYKVVSDPNSRSTMRINAGRQDAGLWAGASETGKKSETVVISFRNVSSTLDMNYMNNNRMLAILDRTFSDPSILDRMDYVTVTGVASPDGYTATNERLAEERALTIKNYITRNFPHVNRDRIITYSAGEDWEGLRRMIEDDRLVPGREAALRILNSALSSEEMRKRLQQLNSGRTYSYLLDNVFPQLRGGVACMIYYKKSVERENRYSDNITNYNIIADQVNITNYNTGSIAEAKNTNRNYEKNSYEMPASRDNSYEMPARDNSYAPPRSEGNYYSASRPPVSERYGQLRIPNRSNRYTSYPTRYNNMPYDDAIPYEVPALALKTNLLYDVVSAVNVELELPLGESWSLAGEYIFPWWLNERKQNAFQLISGSLELRRWFGNRDYRSRLTGWFGGFSLGGGYYDLEKNGKGYQGEFFVPRLNLGYAHEISQNGRWRMEYAFGLGYLRSKYREYEARIGLDDAWHLIYQRGGTYKFVGPLSAKISLVYTINK